MKKVLPFIFLMLSVVSGQAYNYGEHKSIGDQAFMAFMNQLVARQILGSPQQTMQWWKNYAGVVRDSLTQTYTFTQLYTPDSPISYGVFNGLSGDHSPNPLLLEEQ